MCVRNYTHHNLYPVSLFLSLTAKASHPMDQYSRWSILYLKQQFLIMMYGLDEGKLYEGYRPSEKVTSTSHVK